MHPSSLHYAVTRCICAVPTRTARNKSGFKPPAMRRRRSDFFTGNGTVTEMNTTLFNNIISLAPALSVAGSVVVFVCAVIIIAIIISVIIITPPGTA